MDKRVTITTIQVTSETENRFLTMNEIKTFCAERMKITVDKIEDEKIPQKYNCRVILNRLPADYIQNALTGKIVGTSYQSKLKLHSKVCC